MELQYLNIPCFSLFCVVFREARCDRFSIYAGKISKYLRQILDGWRNLHSSLAFSFWFSWISQIMSINILSFDKPTDIWRSFLSYQITIQTNHVYSTLKRRGNDCFHVISKWETREVFLYGGTVHFSRIRTLSVFRTFLLTKNKRSIRPIGLTGPLEQGGQRGRSPPKVRCWCALFCWWVL